MILRLRGACGRSTILQQERSCTQIQWSVATARGRSYEGAIRTGARQSPLTQDWVSHQRNIARWSLRTTLLGDDAGAVRARLVNNRAPRAHLNWSRPVVGAAFGFGTDLGSNIGTPAAAPVRATTVEATISILLRRSACAQKGEPQERTSRGGFSSRARAWTNCVVSSSPPLNIGPRRAIEMPPAVERTGTPFRNRDWWFTVEGCLFVHGD
jgi:hypothetical protein